MMQWVPLKRIAHFRYGDSLPAEVRTDGDFPVIGSGGPSGTHDTRNTGAPAIVIGRKGSYGSVHWASEGGFVIDTAYVIDRGTSAADLRWLYYALKAIDLKAPSQDVGVPGLSRELAHNIPVPLPATLAEQRRIAAFLDRETSRIRSLIECRLQQHALLRERRQAVIDSATCVSGVNSRKLFHALRFLRDGTHQPPARVADGVPLMTARNVSSGTLTLTPADSYVSDSDAKELERALRPLAGDVLLSVKGTIGAVAVVPDGFPRVVLDRNVALLRPNHQAVPEWLMWTLRSSSLQDRMRLAMSFAAQPGLPLGVIRELRIPMPTVAEQRRLCARIERDTAAIDLVATALARQLALIDEHRRALITAAVTGQIDVTTARGISA